MTHRLFGTVAVVALASLAAATPAIAKSHFDNSTAPAPQQMAQQPDSALKLAMGPTSAPQKPGGTGQAPADTATAQGHQAKAQAFVTNDAAGLIFR